MKIPLLLTALLLTGCVTFEPNLLAPAQSALRLEARALTDPDLRSFVERNRPDALAGGAAETWGFDALTIAAFYFNPELELMRAQRDVVAAGRITAGQRPGLAASIAPARNATTAIPSPRIVTATADLTLETGGKRGYRIARAEQLTEAARLNIASVAWQVRSRVRSRLLALFSASQSANLLAQEQAIHGEILRVLEGQYAAGAISAFALTQARLAANEARLALRDAERLRAEARAGLADAIGIPVGGLDGVEISFDEFRMPPSTVATAEARREALLNRADVLSALAEYAASQSNLQLEIAGQYPDIHLGPGYEYDQGDDKWSLGLGVTLPTNRNRGAIAEAEARRAAAAARFNAVQAGVIGQIDLAAAAFRAALQKQSDANAMVADLDRQAEIAQAMLEVGEISRGDLELLQLQLSVSALARLDALVEAQQAAGQLEDAVQAPLALSPVIWESSPQAFEPN